MEYRLPDIKEFVDGFTFEVYSEGYWEDSIEDFWGWYFYTIGGNNWREMSEIKFELEVGHIRTAEPKV